MNSYSTSWWSLLLINRPREDERLSWPCWLIYSGRLTHKVIIRPASSQAQDRESSPVKDKRSTTVLRRQLKLLVWCICRVKAVWSLPERFWGEVLTKRRYTNVLPLPFYPVCDGAEFTSLVLITWNFESTTTLHELLCVISLWSARPLCQHSNLRTIVENTPFLCLSARLAH